MCSAFTFLTQKSASFTHQKGLYFTNILHKSEKCVLINTVAYNKNKYSHSDYLRAINTRKLQSIIGNPSYAHFRKLVKNNHLKNCPIFEADIIASEDIFGKSLQILKGKTTRIKSAHARSELTTIPPTIVHKYKNLELFGDIIRINGLRFILTMSLHLKFITSE